ncbi:unnamed protein product [Phaeothamnion confervicola]
MWEKEATTQRSTGVRQCLLSGFGPSWPPAHRSFALPGGALAFPALAFPAAAVALPQLCCVKGDVGDGQRSGGRQDWPHRAESTGNERGGKPMHCHCVWPAEWRGCQLGQLWPPAVARRGAAVALAKRLRRLFFAA